MAQVVFWAKMPDFPRFFLFSGTEILVGLTVIDKKTGENRPNCLEIRKILGFRFSCSALFLPYLLKNFFLSYSLGRY